MSSLFAEILHENLAAPSVLLKEVADLAAAVHCWPPVDHVDDIRTIKKCWSYVEPS